MHDAWAPYDTYTGADHALYGAHVLRELVAATESARRAPGRQGDGAAGHRRVADLKNLAEDAHRVGECAPEDGVAVHRQILRSRTVGVTPAQEASPFSFSITARTPVHVKARG
ncbi:hypothetical protein GCM10009753_04090 [Streptantibioticus ferralitis]